MDEIKAKRLTFARTAEPLPKSALMAGYYYIGVSRNACVARWDGEKFLHWRIKWGYEFIETIKHREDEENFDVFDAWRQADERQVREIPLVIDAKEEAKDEVP